jgi:hypothetical protein
MVIMAWLANFRFTVHLLFNTKTPITITISSHPSPSSSSLVLTVIFTFTQEAHGIFLLCHPINDQCWLQWLFTNTASLEREKHWGGTNGT